MRIIEKITLILYANIMLILSVVALLTVFGVLDVNVVIGLIKAGLITEPASKIILGASIVFILLSIRCIFFDPTAKREINDRKGITLANDNGKLMISKETLENLVEAVTKNYENAKDVSSRIELDKDNNVKVFVNLIVSADTVIKDLTIDLQEKIKIKIKEATDLEVKEVNVSIKKALPEENNKA